MPRAGLNSKGMGVAGEKVNVELSESRTPVPKPEPISSEIVNKDPKVVKFKAKAVKED